MTAARVPDPGELAEDLAEIKRAVERGARDTRLAIDALASRIESTYVRKDVYEARHATLVDKVGKFEDRLTWSFRTAVTALVLPILVGVVLTIILSGGAR